MNPAFYVILALLFSFGAKDVISLDLGAMNPQARSVAVMSAEGIRFFSDWIYPDPIASVPALEMDFSDQLDVRVPVNAGDVDGDGIDDILLFYGTYSGADISNITAMKADLVAPGFPFPDGGSPAARATISVPAGIGSQPANLLRGVGIGDLDADGFGDVALGLGPLPLIADPPEWNADIRLYKGSAAPSADWAPATTIALASTTKGDLVTALWAEDVNGDTASDLIIGAVTQNGAASLERSRLLLALGAGALGQSATLDVATGKMGGKQLKSIDLPADEYVHHIRSLGDIDGDSYNDIGVVTKQVDTGKTAVYVIRGRSAWKTYVTSQMANLAVQVFGFADAELDLRGVGDLDNDTYDDLIIHVPDELNILSFVFYGCAELPDGETIIGKCRTSGLFFTLK